MGANGLTSHDRLYVHIKSPSHRWGDLWLAPPGRSKGASSPTCWWARRRSRLLCNLCDRCSWWSARSGYSLRGGDSRRCRWNTGQGLQSVAKMNKYIFNFFFLNTIWIISMICHYKSNGCLFVFFIFIYFHYGKIDYDHVVVVVFGTIAQNYWGLWKSRTIHGFPEYHQSLNQIWSEQ